MDHRTIMAAYNAHELAARRKAPGSMLMPEDIEASIASTAAALGIDRQAVCDAIRRDNGGGWG
jgi:hypothetical protein